MFHQNKSKRAHYSKRPSRRVTFRMLDPAVYVDENGEEAPYNFPHPRLVTMNAPIDTASKPMLLPRRPLPTPGSIVNLRGPTPSEVIDFSASARVNQGSETAPSTSLLKRGSFNPFGTAFQTLLGINAGRHVTALKREPIYSIFEDLAEMQRIRHLLAASTELETQGAQEVPVTNMRTAAPPSPLAREVVEEGNEGDIPPPPPAPPAPPPPVYMSHPGITGVQGVGSTQAKPKNVPLKRPPPSSYGIDDVEVLRTIRNRLKPAPDPEQRPPPPKYVSPLAQELFRTVERYPAITDV